jgi:putative N-acetylmannosamine-6-phosphate epimerase
MSSEIAFTFEKEARLHEEDADVIAEEAAAVHRRAEIIAGIAEVKNEEAVLVADQSEADRLRTAQAQTARQKARSLGPGDKRRASARGHR